MLVTYLFCFHSLKRKIIFALTAQNKKETLVLFIWTLQFESISFSACTTEYKLLVLFINGIKIVLVVCARSCYSLQGYVQEYLRFGWSVFQNVFFKKFSIVYQTWMKKEYHLSSSVFLTLRFLYKHKNIV